LILTVAFFIVLLAVPLLTVSDTIGTPIHHAAPAASGAHEGH
jgi:hypothetical protein